jgi:5-(carboxyamino)imidazole ribonucleotide synthase
MISSIGIVGGGQLGKMMALEAKRMNFYIITLDPTADCPSHSVSDRHIVAGFDDEAALRELARCSDALTYEFEHINARRLSDLEREGYIIYPSPQSLLSIQDKLLQKQTLRNGKIPVPDFTAVESPAQLISAIESMGCPIMLKSRFGGYDGKGNIAVPDKASAKTAFYRLSGSLMAESWVDYIMEISVLACRGADGEKKIYPAVRNVHAESVLRKTIAPAPVSDEINKAAISMAAEVMEIFSGVGMFCVEMFLTEGGRLLVNEVAPRPHNSGHYTIEACVTNQFENHIRAVTNLPLGDATLIKPAVMVNILGEEGYSGPARLEGVKAALAVPGVKLHIYGKSQTKPKRKLGHLTAMADTPEEAMARADSAASYLRILAR